MVLFRLECVSQQRVPKPDRAFVADLPAIGSAKGHLLGEVAQHRLVDALAAEIDDPEDAAHSGSADPRGDWDGGGPPSYDSSPEADSSSRRSIRSSAALASLTPYSTLI